MAQRITLKNLQNLAATINRVTGSPAAAWTKPERSERYVASIGNYHISQAYGGYCLHRMTTEGGGVSDVFSCGHITARDLYERMHAFLRGIEVGRELADKGSK